MICVLQLCVNTVQQHKAALYSYFKNLVLIKIHRPSYYEVDNIEFKNKGYFRLHFHWELRARWVVMLLMSSH